MRASFRIVVLVVAALLCSTAFAAPGTPVITAQSPVTTRVAGWTASVPARAGMTYRWTLSAGTITSSGGAAGVTSGGANGIVYTAGATGTTTLKCVETETATGLQGAAGQAAVQVIAAPSKPTITAPARVTEGDAGRTATVVARTGMTYAWTIAGGTITGAGAGGVTAGGTNTVEFGAGPAGSLTLRCAEVNAAGTPSTAASATVTVDPLPLPPAIAAASPVGAGSKGNKATVTARTGMKYAWTLANGTTSNAAGTTSGGVNTLTWTAGTAGPVDLTCVEKNAGGVASAPATARVIAVPTADLPRTPTISAASPVTEWLAGRTASVTARAGFSYEWTAAGGAITSANGAAGVTTGTTNAIAYTPGAAGTLTLTCLERSPEGFASAPATRTVTVVAAPVSPVVTAPATADAGTAGLTASVPARAGFGYGWSVANGTLSGPAAGSTAGGVNTVTFTAGSPGTLTLSCVEIDGAGTASAPGTARMTLTVPSPEPKIPVVVARSPVTAGEANLTAQVAARPYLTYRWSIQGGLLAGDAGGVTSGGVDTVTYRAPSPGTVTLSAVEINVLGAESEPGIAVVTAVLPPQIPTVLADASVPPRTEGLRAWVLSVPGRTYQWTVANGTLTSDGGAAGVDLGDRNEITYTSGAAGAVALTCREVNEAGLAGGYGTATVTIVTPPGVGHLYFPAHEDDDVYFFDPDIDASVRSGTVTKVVWVIAGVPDWQGRETGAKGSLAADARVASDWDCAYRTYLGGTKKVMTCSLRPMPTVTAAFLRIPDGAAADLWESSRFSPQWSSPVTRLTTQDGATSYTRQELTAVMAEMVAELAPARIGSHDSSLAYGDDHPDHVTSAFFALQAAHAWGMPHAFRIYRGYSVDARIYGTSPPGAEAVNLSRAEYDEKVRVIDAYDYGCESWGQPDFCSRHYAVVRLSGGTGPLVQAGGRCVEAPAAGAGAVVLSPCTASLAQRWTLAGDGSIRSADGRCLALGADGYAAEARTCAGGPREAWTLFSNGQLRGEEGGCLTASGSALAADECRGEVAANLGRPAAAQRFTLRFGEATSWGFPGQLDDADVGAGAGPVRLGDVNGDGRADACLRLSDGVHCAENLGSGGFGPRFLFAPDFSDEAGWDGPAGATIQLADVNGDGLADVCGRSPAGLVCALTRPDGSGTYPATLWSSGTDFSDAAGWGAAGYQGSIRFGDVNGDGRADACGRTATGVVCALSSGQDGFLAARSWLAGEFTDAQGWLPDAYATTLMLGDIDGDGRADVCARGPTGVRCAVANAAGTGFEKAHLWSFRTDFTDAAGWGANASRYGSLRLADVDGDGLADLCGRAAEGLVCASSTGSGFDEARLLAPAFGDAGGFGAAQVGSTLGLSDLGTDRRADACARSASGLVCATAP